ncbi:glycine C-acetyltransferase [Candidatus Gottesmanbacteria bacterium]|nr:glycine C-acetyltransferase [Candidatus Gottesmanbacteria bacterium]
MVDPLDKFYKVIEDMKAKGLYNNIRTISSPQGAYLVANGKKVLNLCSNNYLGLAANERLVAAVKKAVDEHGVGTGAVRTLSGTIDLHIKLEEELAVFKKAEAALLVQSGYIANIVAIQTIMDKDDIVISDALNHASIIDAIRVTGIKNKFIYKHADMGELEARLKEAKKLAEGKKEDGSDRLILVVTDGVFSMDGDIAPLPEIVKLAKQYGAVTMVDDAHGEGVLGDHGRGIVDHFHLHGQVDVEVGTLSKAFGVIGGVVAGKKELVEYYRQKARPFLFSTGLTVADTAALREGVKILMESDELVKKVWENAKYLKDGFTKLGFDTGKSETPITPVMLGDENLAKDFSVKLFEQGVYATPIKFPMVPLGKARLRIMPSASHEKADLDVGLKAFEEVGRELGVLK